ncbi:helix-turn-helix domain-containing protein [Kocuria sp. KH4]
MSGPWVWAGCGIRAEVFPRIRALRTARGWSLDALTERSHPSPSNLSRIETGVTPDSPRSTHSYCPGARFDLRPAPGAPVRRGRRHPAASGRTPRHDGLDVGTRAHPS